MLDTLVKEPIKNQQDFQNEPLYSSRDRKSFHGLATFGTLQYKYVNHALFLANINEGLVESGKPIRRL
jgi:hypothetical protein